MKITACLITKEPEYPKLVLERLTCTDFFDEILITVNSPSVYARYILAAQAKNDIIYTQDDDCMVNHQVLYSKYNGRITNAMPKDRIADTERQGITLVGWGCVFPKEMLNVFDRYIAKYGFDKHLLREADRIFTYCNRPFNTIIQPHEDLPRANSDEAMYKEPSHYISAAEAIEKCKML